MQKNTEVSSKNALIDRLIAKSSLDFSCCGHGKPASGNRAPASPAKN